MASRKVKESLRANIAPKRGPGRPKGGGAKRGRKPKVEAVVINRTGTIMIDNISRDAMARAVGVPTATDLIAKLRPIITTQDDIGSQLESVGVPASEAHLIREFQCWVNSRLLAALARAP